jgi:TonB family protein
MHYPRLAQPAARCIGRAAIVAALLAGLAFVSTASAAPAASQAEPAITVTGVEGDYLRAVHSRIHERWAKGFVEGLTRAPAAAGSAAPVGDKGVRTVVLFAVRWDGTVAEVNVGTSSGVASFDKAAIDAIRTADRFPVPPVDAFSDDGIVHLRWTLARDQRMCSDGQLVRREDPLEEALPRLFIQSRTKEALMRVKRRIDANAAGDPMALFARAWLAKQSREPGADIEAAAALARLGDTRQVDRLRAGLAFPATASTAAAALHATRVDVCPLVRANLTTGDPAARLLAASILGQAGDALPEQSPCAQALAANAGDRKQPGSVRAAALQTLGVLSEATAQRLWPALIKDGDAAVRAAAISASARPGGGRPALYRLIPFLRDPSVDVRAATAASMVRAAGDLALDQLPGALKDPDPRIGVALATALGHQQTAASAAMLGRLAKRDAMDVRVAAVSALAARSDAAARALVTPILEAAAKDARTPQAIRQLAATAAGAGKLQAQVTDADFGLSAFRALLAARKYTEAADVLVTQFDRLPARTVVAYLAAWLENPPGGSTSRISADDLKP